MIEPRNRLGRLRRASGLSKADLAAQITSTCGVATTYGAVGAPVHEPRAATIDRWERGETQIPEKHWADLAAIFGTSIAHLLGLDHESEGPDGPDGGMRQAA